MAFKPFFSIVTPSLNQGAYIEETIRSVADQGYPDFEHIVVDGGSTDGTLDVLRKHPHLRWTSEPDSGRTEAVNKGFSRARGQIIGWLSSDDCYAPGVFNAVAAFFEANPDCAALIGRAEVVDGEGRRLFIQEEPAPEGFTRKGIIRFWKHGTLPQPSLFFRKKALEEVGLLDESLKSYMDFDFMIRLAGRFAIHRREEVFSRIRLHLDAGSVVDIAEGTLVPQLARISRRHWGKGAEFYSHALSYAVYWPQMRWRSHYQAFAFRARAALGGLADEKPSFRQLIRSLPLFPRYPAAYVAVGVKRVLRRLGVLGENRRLS